MGLENSVGGGGGIAVVVAGSGEGAQGGVPAGLQGVGDEPVGGIDGEVAVPGGAGGLFGAPDVGSAELVCASAWAISSSLTARVTSMAAGVAELIPRGLRNNLFRRLRSTPGPS